MSKNVVIIDYGAGNVKSVEGCLNTLGINSVLSSNREVIQSADYVIFPGVGHAKAAMDNLKKHNLATLIPQLTQPVLGVCLGMQLMCAYSEEGDLNENTIGLGIFDIPILKFIDSPKIPHIGWNNLENTKGFCAGFENYFYFVHSYYAPICAETVATCSYGTTFSAALQKDNFFGAQFHPEKSSNAGIALLNSFFTTN